MEFAEVIQDIRQGNYHGSAALWQTVEREEFLLYSAPYLQNRLILVGRKGADVTMTSFSELNGKKVGVVGTYAYGNEVDAITEVDWIAGPDDQENLKRLIRVDIDYILVDAL